MRFFNQKPRRHPIIQNLPYGSEPRISEYQAFTIVPRGESTLGIKVEIIGVERSQVGKFPLAFGTQNIDTGEKHYLPLRNEQRLLRQIREQCTLEQANDPIGMCLEMSEETAAAGYQIYIWKPIGFRSKEDA